MLHHKFNNCIAKISKIEPMKTVFILWREWILWDNLKKRATDKFISSMYIWLFLVPTVKKFLSKLNDSFPIEVDGHVYELMLQSPFSWDMFFYSALCFVIGNCIFYLFSPKFIKLYNNSSEYLASGRTVDYLISILKNDFPNDEYKYLRLVDTQWDKNPAAVGTRFYDDYDKAKKLGKRYRVICAASYLIGFVLLAIVVMQNIWWMIENSL